LSYLGFQTELTSFERNDRDGTESITYDKAAGAGGGLRHASDFSAELLGQAVWPDPDRGRGLLAVLRVINAELAGRAGMLSAEF